MALWISDTLPPTVAEMSEQLHRVATELENGLEALAEQRRKMEGLLPRALVADGCTARWARAAAETRSFELAKLGAALNEAASSARDALAGFVVHDPNLRFRDGA